MESILIEAFKIVTAVTSGLLGIGIVVYESMKNMLRLGREKYYFLEDWCILLMQLYAAIILLTLAGYLIVQTNVF